MCTFSLDKKHIFVKPCLKQHAFLIHPMGVFHVFFFARSNFDVLRPKKKGAQTKKKARNLARASKFRSPGPPKGAPSGRKGCQQGGCSEFCGTKGAQGWRATLYQATRESSPERDHDVRDASGFHAMVR